jgi:RimJ/RimL family protein N-acetyltransferase
MGHITAATPTPSLETQRLRLDPLRQFDADEMVGVLGDEALYEFTGGEPPTLEALEARYRAQVAGSGRQGEAWHNWILRLLGTGEAIGFVQTTVTPTESDLAWVVGVDWQGHGFATEAARAMCDWLIAGGAGRVVAHIHPQHLASGRVAAALGLTPTDEIDADGEVVWALEVGEAATSGRRRSGRSP